MNVIAEVERFILDEILVGSRTHIDPDESLVKAGILDSLALLRLISFLEDGVGVAIEDEELIVTNFETLNKINELIEKKGHNSGRKSPA